MLALLRLQGLKRSFVLSGPAGGDQFGACLGDDGRFLGALDGGTITPVEAPRNEFGAANGHGHDGRQQHEGNEWINHPCPLPQAPKEPANSLGVPVAGVR